MLSSPRLHASLPWRARHAVTMFHAVPSISRCSSSPPHAPLYPMPSPLPLLGRRESWHTVCSMPPQRRINLQCHRRQLFPISNSFAMLFIFGCARNLVQIPDRIKKRQYTGISAFGEWHRHSPYNGHHRYGEHPHGFLKLPYNILFSLLDAIRDRSPRFLYFAAFQISTASDVVHQLYMIDYVMNIWSCTFKAIDFSNTFLVSSMPCPHCKAPSMLAYRRINALGRIFHRVLEDVEITTRSCRA